MQEKEGPKVDSKVVKVPPKEALKVMVKQVEVITLTLINPFTILHDHALPNPAPILLR